jgi:hypothetical protein
MRAAKKAGHVGSSFRSSQGRSRSRFGRGRRAAVSIRLRSNARRVVMKARVVRHQGSRFRSAPLPKHLAYLKHEGVTRMVQMPGRLTRPTMWRTSALSPSVVRTIATISGSSSRLRMAPRSVT